MGRRAPRGGKNGPIILLGRLAFAAVCLVLLTLVSIQFARIVSENVAMAHTLASVQNDISALQRQKRTEERKIHRLMDPQGAIPEIHDRLHLVRPNEAIIYVTPSRQ